MRKSRISHTSHKTLGLPRQAAGALFILAGLMVIAKARAADDKDFIQKAAKGNVAEVELARLAQERASDPEVKDMAQHILNDHQQANQDLQKLAAKKGITLPHDARMKDEVTKAKLSRLKGPEFDKDYVKAMVKDHQKDIKEYQREANQGKDPEVKQYASQTVATLQHHLEMAQRLDRRLNQARGS